jgi:hypothetical protein
MSDWIHDLPLGWTALLIFGLTYLSAAAVYAVVAALSVGERARAFKAVSPGMLPPLGIIFGLFVAFTAAQVWNDNERASAAVNSEARALRAVQVLSATFPGEPEAQLRNLIHRYIEEASSREWPMMAHRTATLQEISSALAEALQVTLSLSPGTPGQQIAQREITAALGNAADARRQRILISQYQVNWIKWSTLLLQALCALVAIAMVHADNRLASLTTLGLFATGIAASVVIIVAHDRPFIGQLAIGPEPLLQVIPEAADPAAK